MNVKLKLALASLKHNTARTFYLTVLISVICFSVFVGETVTSGLCGGMESLKKRLGADIIVIPSGKNRQQNFEGILLGGKPGFFYMPNSVLAEISQIDGAEMVTSQFYLASLTADCCSTELQIMGFDPDSDFIVMPWLTKSYAKKLQPGEVVAGSDVFVPKTGIIKIYNQDIKVVGSMDKTGTGLDFTVFGNTDTVKLMLRSAQKLGVSATDADPDRVVSSVMIKVRDGFDKSDIVNTINRTVAGVQAFENRDMVLSFTSRLNHMTLMIKSLVAFICVLAMIMVIFVFSVMLNERKNEFGVLKIMGFTVRSLLAVVFCELVFICAAGSLTGVSMAAVWSLSFKSFLESELGVPFLFDGYESFLLHAGVTAAAGTVLSLLLLLPFVLKVLSVPTDAVMRE